MIEPNGTRTFFEGISNDNNGQLSQPVFIFTMFFQYTACYGLFVLLPILFIKIGILPSLANSLLDLSLRQTYKGTNFLGIIFTSIIASIWLIIFDKHLYNKHLHGSTSVAVLYIVLPLALPLFALMDILIIVLYCRRYCRSKPYRNQCCSLVYRAAGCVVIMIFLQLLAFHVGWMLPLLVAFPMKIVILIFEGACIMLYTFFAIRYITAQMQYCYLVRRTAHDRRVHPAMKFRLIMHENGGLAMLSTSGLYMTLIYLKNSDDNGSRDVITIIAAAVFPTILIGPTTWMVKKCITTNPIQED